MTLPSEKIGDKGQRYEVRYTRNHIECVFGWSTTLEGAIKMRSACKAWPSSQKVWIVDREVSNEKTIV